MSIATAKTIGVITVVMPTAIITVAATTACGFGGEFGQATACTGGACAVATIIEGRALVSTDRLKGIWVG